MVLKKPNMQLDVVGPELEAQKATSNLTTGVAACSADVTFAETSLWLAEIAFRHKSSATSSYRPGTRHYSFGVVLRKWFFATAAMFVSPAPPNDGLTFSDPAAEIERFRARHRRLCRAQQQQIGASTSKIEALDVDDGRSRKISAKWRQKQQQQTLHRSHFDDGAWSRSTDAETHTGFNAFDFSSSPEAFYDEPEVVETAPVEDEEEKRRQHMDEVAKQVTSMGFNSASLWEHSFPGLRQLGGPIRQLPVFGQSSVAQSLWMPPMHVASRDDRRRAPCQQPQQYFR